MAVVLAGQTSQDRFEGAKKLLNYGFSNYSFEEIKADLKEKTVPVLKGETDSVGIEAKGSVGFLCEKAKMGDIKQTVNFEKEIKAPIKKGQVVGYIDIYSGEENIGQIPITATDNLKKRNFPLSFKYILNGLFKI